MSESDREEGTVRWVLQAQKGDREAFEHLIRQHMDGAWAMARSNSPGHHEAEEVLQDALFRAWQRIDQCREPERFAGWLARVVRSVALNRIDRVKRRQAEPLEPLAPRLSDSGPAPDRRVERAELRARLERAMEVLTPGQKEVLVLYDLEGWSHREIAEMMEISEAMSRRHLSDARARMRKRLTEDDEGRAEPEAGETTQGAHRD